MKAGQGCVKILEQFECSGDVSKFLKAYQDSVGVWTIGIGTTLYPDGRKVKQGDSCTEQEAYAYCLAHLDKTVQQIQKVVKKELKQHQVDALASFTYNLGIGTLTASTLLKKINVDPDDSTIPDEFRRYVKAGGRVLAGLVKRREVEALLYGGKN